MAIEPLSGKVAWQVAMMDLASSAGMLATDGGLLFTGLLTGEFIALDQDTARRCGSSRPGRRSTRRPSLTRHKGRQYVTVLSGRGGSVASRLVTDSVPPAARCGPLPLMPE